MIVSLQTDFVHVFTGFYIIFLIIFFCDQVNANIQQSLDTEIETKDDQGIRESDSYFSVEEDEEVKLKDVSVL